MTSLPDTLETPGPTHGMRLEAKMLNKEHIPGTKKWELFDTTTGTDNTKSTTLDNTKSRYTKYAEYAILIRRKVIRSQQLQEPSYVTKIIVWSAALQCALRIVLEGVQIISWAKQPLKLDPQILLAFLPRLRQHLDASRSKGDPVEEVMISHLSFLINFLEAEYAVDLQKIRRLLSRKEIAFDLLWSLFLPGSTLYMTCKVTSARRAVRLIDIQLCTNPLTKHWACEYVDVVETSHKRYKFGLAPLTVKIEQFVGVSKIVEVEAFPIDYHPDAELQTELITRGREWARWSRVHIAQYDGFAFRKDGGLYRNFKIKSRIIIDWTAFSMVDPNYELNQTASRQTSSSLPNLDDDHLLLTSPIVYGYSLVDHLWLEFNIENVSRRGWNPEVFENLSIDPSHKVILKCLVARHNQNHWHDHSKGKGLGLVIYLSGPPGVGKSLIVQAVSEYLYRVPYVVAGSDLGTTASTLEKNLIKVFNLLPRWNAFLVIKDADVFLERRTSSNLQRNAMVAVFLHMIEYFGGILFLITDRIKEVDPAFQSCINLSLKYPKLSLEMKKQLWISSISSHRHKLFGIQELSLAEVQQLVGENLNGHQINNVMRITTALADNERAALSFKHLQRSVEMVRNS